MSSRLSSRLSSIAGVLEGKMLRKLPLVSVARVRYVFVALCLLGPTLAQAAQDRPVNGKVYLVPNVSDPTVYVTLKGAGALQMYNSMQVKAVDDACRGGGRKYKLAGSVACSLARDGKSAVCDFGLNLKSGTASVGQPC
jgi:hypothetical protein